MIDLSFFISYIEQLSYVAIVLLMLVGSVGLPFPEELVLLAAGYVSSLGYMNIYGALIVSLLAVLGGDMLGFLIGWRGGKLFRRLLSEERFVKIERYFEQHGSKTIFLSRFLTGVRVFFPIAAGATKMKFKEFIFWDALAAIIWVPLTVMAGYLFGAFLPVIIHWLGRIDMVFGILFAVFLLVLLISVKKRKEIKRKLEDIRHEFFTHLRKDEKPLSVLLFGNPKKVAQRVYSKKRWDGRVKLFVEFIKDEVNVRCIHSNEWLRRSTYDDLISEWIHKLGKPKEEVWPTKKSSARRK
jgi:membrane protein DedA with SNARE-associated domain